MVFADTHDELGREQRVVHVLRRLRGGDDGLPQVRRHLVDRDVPKDPVITVVQLGS